MKHRLFAMVAIVAAGTLTVSGSAFAQPSQEDVETLVSDAQIIAENAPAAAEGLAEDLQGAAETLQETQSTNATADEVTAAGVAAGSTLVAGTEQFGDLGLGLTLLSFGVNSAHDPWTNAIDNQDPSVVDPADFEAIATYLQENGQDDLLCGAGLDGGLLRALVHLLTGNIIDPPLGIGNSFYVHGVVNPILMLFNATQGTPYAGVFQTAGIASIVVGAAAQDDVQDLEAELAPVFDGAAPATGPVIEQVEAQEAENCS